MTMMAGIPTRVHGVIDYTVGASLIAAPETLGLADNWAASTFTRSMGAAAVAYSLCTDYELGLLKLISMPVHLRVDGAWAAALALGPWVLRFTRKGKRYWLPHALVAVSAVAILAASETSGHKAG